MHANTKYFIAGSFRDATRVADINAELWKDLFLFNKANVRAEIAKLQVQLNKWDKALADNDEQTLVTMMKEAKSKREDLFNAKNFRWARCKHLRYYNRKRFETQPGSAAEANDQGH